MKSTLIFMCGAWSGCIVTVLIMAMMQVARGNSEQEQ